MWFSIARATARPLRLASVRQPGALALTAEPQLSAAAAARFAALLSRRQFSVTRIRPAATAVAKKPAPKKPAAAKKAPAKKPAAKKAAPKKRAVAKKAAPKKKKAAAKKKPAPRKKKALTDEEKKAAKIRELKKTALLARNTPREPSPRSTNTWQIFLAKNTQPLKDATDVRQTMRTWVNDLSARFKALSVSEVDELHAEAELNKKKNEEELQHWLALQSIEEVARINAARASLRRLGVAPRLVRPVKDHRAPKKPLNSYIRFLQARYKSGDLAGLSVSEAAKKAGSEWKALSEQERSAFTKS